MPVRVWRGIMLRRSLMQMLLLLKAKAEEVYELAKKEVKRAQLSKNGLL